MLTSYVNSGGKVLKNQRVIFAESDNRYSVRNVRTCTRSLKFNRNTENQSITLSRLERVSGVPSEDLGVLLTIFNRLKRG